MGGVVDALEGPGVAAEGVAGDVDAIVEEVVVEFGEVLEVWVGLPVGVGLACLEGNGRLTVDLPYKNESQSNFWHFFIFNHLCTRNVNLYLMQTMSASNTNF